MIPFWVIWFNLERVNTLGNTMKTATIHLWSQLAPRRTVSLEPHRGRGI